MRKKFENKGTTLVVGDLVVTLFVEGLTSLITITFDKELLEMYAEDYIKEHFEMSEKDGWIRRIDNYETV
ncbi:hypothetical protein CIRMBP1310_01708 [Enterococcus cecorum]|uniref:hypothetical protein n=1 Tax=Enterococcus cecorum TaxID=44008 RepID=UPI000AE7D146|nr:hypothetical protein [Enterococcus cecorum]MCJ0535924.1 hypothetical protein [Enterococcus cecorum]MCJ0554975.1 hypothetical protein [Enterococcus cecorum]CAI3480429.1 hypothetical protein CIRMBP1310_01708 [Enterococcus cecorum]CAI3503126.1 hypothetical protein CIRMBP1311_02111 [Enterococcus cecorum]